MPTARQLRLEGNAHFESGDLNAAVRCFRDSTDRFVEERSTSDDAIDEYVKAAGNLCVCYHMQGQLDLCFRTAREVLGIYPVIPKAFGAIGMCIMDRLAEHQAAMMQPPASSADAAGIASNGATRVPATAPLSIVAAAGSETPMLREAGLVDARAAPTNEQLRGDPSRYLVRLSGVLCTVDEAHTYLCRAILLSTSPAASSTGVAPPAASLQVSLGPYVESAVRLISEQLLFASHALEREHGASLQSRLCPLEDFPKTAPTFLSTAPPAVRQTVRELPLGGDASASSIMPHDAAAAVLAEVAAASASQPAGDATAPQTSSAATARPVEFMLSGQPVAVPVCHGERGGLPRGLPIVRAERPFAVAAWLLPLPAADTAAVTLPQDESQSLTGSPAVRVAAVQEHPSPDVVLRDLSASVVAGGDGGSDAMGGPSMPRGVFCACCGRQIELSAMLSGSGGASACQVCGAVAYCSEACERSYGPRHEKHECRLRLTLQARVAELAAHTPHRARGGVSPATAAAADEEAAGQREASGTMAGSGWSADRLHRQVLPLAIAVYSGLCERAAGWERVAEQLRRGAQRTLLAALPISVGETVSTLAEHVGSGAAAAVSALPASEHDDSVSLTPTSVLQSLVLLARLRQCAPPTHGAEDADRADFPFSFFYAEHLLFRHSCEPNCVWSNALRTVTTSRFVLKGEELTLAVLDNGSSSGGTGGESFAELFPQHWPWQIRRRWLLVHHGFRCACTRCVREGESLNPARGDLSGDMTEQLLTGDRTHRPRMAERDGVTHPTQHFHPRLQRTIRESLATALGGTAAHIQQALRQLAEAGKLVAAHLLPSHYLLEDLRTAVCRVASLHTCGEAELQLWRSTGRESILFEEAMWAGATAAKAALLSSLPPPADGAAARRRVHYRQLRSRRQQQQVGTDASADDSFSISAAPELLEDSPEKKLQQQRARLSAADGGAAEGRRRRQPPRPTRDFEEGTIVDHFYGSYHSWYA